MVISGRGTVIRMLLRIADIDWKDTVVSIKNTTEWLAKKGEFEKEALG